jgi:hypothetical protein
MPVMKVNKSEVAKRYVLCNAGCIMSKRNTGPKKKTTHAKKGPKRLAAKKRMLEIKAMKPAERKKALAAEK